MDNVNELLERAAGDRGLQWRHMEIRASDDPGQIEGIGVPWGEIANIGYFTESIARGAVQDSDSAQIWWRHVEPIGKLQEHRDTDEGWWIRGGLSDTVLGRDARTLVRDGVVTGLSIGFEPDEYEVREDETGTHITHTKIRVREISLVPMGAYPGAQITNVREANTSKKGTTLEPETAPVTAPAPGTVVSVAPDAETLNLRSHVDELERRMGLLSIVERPAPVDQRSAGAILKALVSGDTATIESYNETMKRAYTGATTAESIQLPQWVGDLTRLVEEAAPLRSIFSTGVLPAQGNTLEFGKLKSITGDADTQENEGDDLDYIEVAVETDTTPILTGGGWSEISRQSIERSSVNILDLTLRAQALSLGKWINKLTRTAYSSTVAAQLAAGNKVTLGSNLAGASFQTWLDAIVDAAIKFEKLGLPITGLIANAKLFKALGHVEASDGRPILLVQGDGTNNIGTFNPVGLSADLAGVTIRLDAGLANVNAAGSFVNGSAIRVYDDGVKRLQDENIVNLTRQFSVYTYAAVADEIPEAIVPVEIPA